MAKPYIFQFKAIENVTKLGANISRTFEGMQQRALKFKSAVNVLPKSIDQLESELVLLKREKKKSFSVKEIRRLRGEIAKTERQINKMKGGIGGIGGMFKKISKPLRGFGGLVAGAFAANAISGFGRGIIDTLAKFQRFEAVLTNTLGSKSAAQGAMRQITDFAAKTPFQIDELTGSFVKLANRGFIPTQKEMTKIGDLAASQGKGFDQLTEAILDAETGQFERLLEFGIRASKEGDKVRFSFKNVDKSVSFDNLRQSLLGLGDLKGVKGAMKAIGKTTGGLLSNMSDQWITLKLQIGKVFAPFLSVILPKFITGLTIMAAWVKRNRALLFGFVKIVGKVGGAFLGLLIPVRIFTFLRTQILLVNATLKISKILMLAFNLIASISPFGWIAIAVGLIVVLLAKFDGVRKFLIVMTKFFFNNNPFFWMVNLITKIFPSFGNALRKVFGGVRSLFAKIFNFIKDKIIAPLKKAFGSLFDFSLPKIDPLATDLPTTGKDNTGLAKVLKGANSINKFKPIKTSDNKIGLANEIQGIQAKGSRIVNVTIGKLVEQLIFQTTNLQESSSKIKVEVEKALLSAVNEVNYAQ